LISLFFYLIEDTHTISLCVHEVILE